MQRLECRRSRRTGRPDSRQVFEDHLKRTIPFKKRITTAAAIPILGWPLFSYGEKMTEEYGEKMTEEQKSEIMLLRRQGIGYKRIAAFLEIPVETVKSYCRRNPEEDATQPIIPIGSEATFLSTCKHCGRPLQQTPGKRRREFCGSACRAAYWRAHPKKLQFQRCAGCGTLLPMGNVSRKYCSHACYIQHRFGRENHV